MKDINNSKRSFSLRVMMIFIFYATYLKYKALPMFLSKNKWKIKIKTST